MRPPSSLSILSRRNPGDHHVDFAWGHGGQLIVVVDDLSMVIATTSNPFYLEHNDES